MTASEKVYNYGFNEGKLISLYDLVKKQIITTAIGAQQANMAESDFIKCMNEAGYKL